MNKRVLGYWNELRKKKYRAKNERRNFFKKISYHLKSQPCDLLIITGDFSNLSLHSEFQLAKEELQFFLGKQRLILFAGNHDRYLKKTTKEERFEKYFAEYCPFSWKTREQKSIHTIELEKFQLVFFDMAEPNFLTSRGRLAKNFFNEFKEKIEGSPFIKLGFGHYPLGLTEKESFWRKLKGAEKLEQLLMKEKFLAYFHGHIHQNWIKTFSMNGHSMKCINSGGAIFGKEYPLSFHKIELFSDGSFKVQLIK